MGSESPTTAASATLRPAREASVSPGWDSIADLPIAVAVFDRGMRYLAASRRWLQVHGLEGRVVVGALHYDLFPDLPERWKAVHQRVLAGETMVAHDDCFERADGSRQWVSWECRPWYDASGAVGGLHLWAEDVTARVEAEAQLRERLHDLTVRAQVESALREELSSTTRMLESTGFLAKVGGWEFDVRSTRLQWSLETCRIHEIDPPVTPPLAEAINFYAPEARPVIESLVNDALQHGTPYDVELPLITASGRPIWVRAQCAPEMENGKAVLLRGAFHDITERRRLETEAAQANALLERMSELGKIGGWELDVATGQVTMSREAARIHEVDFESLPLSVSNGSDFYPPEAWRIVSSAVKTAIEHGTDYDLESPFITAKGRHIWVRLRAIAVQEHGKTIKLQGSFQDITALKRAEQQREQSHNLLVNLARLVPSAIYQYRLYPDGRSAFPYANDGINDIYEVTPEEVQEDATPVFGRLHPEDAERVGQLIMESARTLEEFYCEFRVILPRQGLRWRWSQAHPERMADGGTLWHGIISDITQRKEAEAAVAESSLRMNLALRAAKAGTWDWDVVGGTINWSPELFDLFGVAQGTAGGSFETWRAALHPEDVALAEARIAEAVEGRRALDSDYRVVLPDGEIRWINSVGQCVYDGAGRPIRMVGLCLDITDRKRADAALRESEDRTRAIMQSAPDAIITLDASGTVLAWNASAETMFGRTEAEMQGQPLSVLMPERYREQHLAGLARVTAGGVPHVIGHTVEVAGLHRGGVEFPLELSLSRWESAAGWRFTGILRDITKRKRAEAALRDSERHFKTMFEGSPFGIAHIDSGTGQILHVNPMFAKIAGRTVEQMATIDWMSITHPDDVQADLDNMARMNAGETTGSQMEKRYLRPGGDIVWIRMTIAALTSDATARRQHLAMIEDITDRKEAEQEKAKLEAQLAQSQKLESVGLLAGGVAHDFNNMLGVILGTAEVAIAQVDEMQPLHDDLLEIRKAAVRSADLTRQLLAFARQQTIAPTVLDLNETVPGMLSMLQRLIGEDIGLHWQPAAALWPVLMDRSQMDQILTNLCVNARHAIADVGTVTIATANAVVDAAFCDVHAEAIPGDYVLLSVRDTGHGMDAATLARIFEPFFSTKGVGAGTGLGLATVYGAVKQNQGFVTVSSALGEGATFEIYLPRHKGAPTPARRTGPVAADLRGNETILVVEDEPSLVRLVTKALEAQGYTVLAASSAADALRLASANAGEIHLLLSDVVMPEMNGRDLATALLKLRPTLKPLFMSGHTADVIAIRGLLAPEVTFLEKPFTPVALAAKVREVLDGR